MIGVRVTRLTTAVTALLVCALPVTGLAVTGTARGPAAASLELAAAASGCPGFGPRDVLRGRLPRRAATCRPLGIDAGIIRVPIADAQQRDRHNYGSRRVHGRMRHGGTDFRARCGTAVRASHAGRVVLTRGRGRGPRTVGVSTGPRRLTTWYGPLKKVRVHNGAKVHAGRRLGSVGKVRRSRCHLHFGVTLRTGAKDPARVNPSRWLRHHRGRHVGGMAPPDRRRGAFVAATLNVLGDSHTRGRGRKRRQYAGSARRMGHAVSLLRSNRVSLVGLQELQGKQKRQFLRKTRGWRVFSPRQDPQDSIAWRAARFRLLEGTSLKIPYFKNERSMPVVRLRDRKTGRAFVVISVHNPARKSLHKRRAKAVRREVRVAHRLQRRGSPVILMGDFNDRSRPFYCQMTRKGFRASSGGVRGRRCRPSQVAGIDWIFGTKGIRFQAHQRMQGGLVSRTTDHPLILARVRR